MHHASALPERAAGCYHAVVTCGKPATSVNGKGEAMVEMVRSNDLVHLSWAQAMLAAEGIDCVVLDHHISAVEGGISAFGRRLVVADGDAARARAVLDAAEAATVE